MNIVEYALAFRKSFYVLAVTIVLLGASASTLMTKDVLPAINIPSVVLVWTYTGLDAPEMAERVTTYAEFSISSNVGDIRRMESQTLQGTSIQKITFQPDVNLQLAMAQIVSAANAIRSQMPPGINPPVIMQFSASTAPVIQLAMSSPTESQPAIFTYGQYRIRQALSTVPGSTMPAPYGGTPQQVMVDLNLRALQAYGMTPQDVTDAVNAENITAPSGLFKVGTTQFALRLNSMPTVVASLNDMPVKRVHGSPILLRDVATVREGSPPQLNQVYVDGKPGVLLTIFKNGAASTLSVVDAVKALLPGIRAAAPKDMTISTLADQSVFVVSAIKEVVQEAATAAALTGLTILLFLGSWRSTLIVMLSIPLAILSSLSVLWALGETMNVMTLGGLALAVGILVDDATVAIENTYRLIEEGRPFRESVVRGASEIAKPALISTLAICCAFISVVTLNDVPKYLFTPQAFAVVFAMLASYVLSRTLVPILIDTLCGPDHAEAQAAREGRRPAPKGPFGRFHAAFNRGFARFHIFYLAVLHRALDHRWATLTLVALLLASSGGLMTFVGRDYFPQISSDQIVLHIRGRPGLRIEEAETLFTQVEGTVRTVIPPRDIKMVLDNIGLPASNYNMAFNDGSAVAYYDGQMLITLAPGAASSESYEKALRPVLRARYPDAMFYFQASDLITQALDFGTLAPIDVQVSGRHTTDDLKVALDLDRRMKGVKGLVDVHLHQIPNAPQFFADVDRQRAMDLGLTEKDIASNLDVSLSGSWQLQPSFWTDPQSGIPYQLWVQTPEYRNASLAALANTPMLVGPQPGHAAGNLTLLQNVAQLRRSAIPSVIAHVNTQPTFDIYANLQDRDLGSVTRDLKPILAAARHSLSAPDTVSLRGQVGSMNDAFAAIGLGMAVAIVAVYLLMVVNFQDWIDPLVVICALPLAFCGIVMSLFVTQTTFSIPSLMGAIMSVGVASSNSILLVTFAREHREAERCSARQAAIEAGNARLRPVLMTAAAMFVGLIPMALGLGTGSEQNAALARAVMGGVLVATGSTLLFVPFLYSLFRKNAVIAEPKP